MRGTQFANTYFQTEIVASWTLSRNIALVFISLLPVNFQLLFTVFTHIVLLYSFFICFGSLFAHFHLLDIDFASSLLCFLAFICNKCSDKIKTFVCHLSIIRRFAHSVFVHIYIPFFNHRLLNGD